ncbi:plakophilin-1-like isoform X2 [Engraulis encrasicolus]|uniref:plakophilin-1-like isoform X2 n=1 Tax=Engraulis encrasicolus TaxID=184585 RepID=UPI002FD67548
MSLDLLKSAPSDWDTSLALPSDFSARSAQQRVMEQVNTLRGKTNTLKGSGSVVDGYGCTLGSSSPRLSDHAKLCSRKAMSSVSQSMSRVSTARRTNSTLSTKSRLSINTCGSGSRFQMEGIGSGSSMPDLGYRSLPQSRSATALYQARNSNSSSRYNVLTLGNSRSHSPVLQCPIPQTVVDASILNHCPLPPRPIPQTVVDAPIWNQSPVLQCPIPQTVVGSPIPAIVISPVGTMPVLPDQSIRPKTPSVYSLGQHTIRPSTKEIKTVSSLREAVQCLSTHAENFQLYGASYIQHSTYTDDKARQQVLQLEGIPPLVALLQSPNPVVQQAASAALRNLVYMDRPNKEEVGHCGGVTQVAQLLQDSQSTDTMKHLTGLLWNLSSEDSLKADIMKNCLLVLTDSVIVPYSTGNLNNYVDTETFFNATACLRNLSSIKQVYRQAMRKSSSLVDALVLYVFDCVDAQKFENKSLENCLCILHNLTYQLQAESPQLFSRINSLSTRCQADAVGPIRCFSPRSQTVQQKSSIFDYPVLEDNNPSGCAWLLHSKLLEAYLNLLRESQNQQSLEACCGALLNLTASQGTASEVLSQTIVRRLSGLPAVTPLLKSEDVGVSCSAVGLLGNLAQHPALHSTIAHKALGPLADFISAGVPNMSEGGSEVDETMATACLTLHALMMADQKNGKGLLSNSLINSLNNMSYDGQMEKTRNASAFLLYNFWKQKSFQSSLKKRGMQKRTFVNDTTTAAHRSMVVID